ncbi:MAG TPA: methyltransferase domain-containing protein [Candidatus Baltobacteraceae bacterium]|nr:methyltransferase domain-containing protein [Candidatus Baltobacteraceae bacterium]
MSAAANLFTPETAGLENEWKFSSLPPGVFGNDAQRNPLQKPVWPGVNCEAIVSFYESDFNAADGVILHLGAGRGKLMETLRQHGYTVMGCEPSPRPTRLAREAHGFDARTLHCSSVENFLRWMRRIGQKSQAIFFRHGWEHNLEFQALLPRMAEILCEGGRIISVLPPPTAYHPREAHLSFLNELAVAGASCNGNFEVASVDCDYENRFMAFVLKKLPAPSRT